MEAALYEKLAEDPDAMWEMCNERAERLRRERAPKASDRQKLDREVERLEAEIGRLMRVVASGGSYSDREIAGRRARVEEIKAKLSEPEVEVPDEEEFDRLLRETTRWLESHGPVVGGCHTDPVLGRQVLRRLGVERIVVKPDGDGWAFEGVMDLERLLNRRSTGSGAAPPDVDKVE